MKTKESITLNISQRSVFNTEDKLGLFNTQSSLGLLFPKRENDILSLLTSNSAIIAKYIESGKSITFVKDQDIVRQTNSLFEKICNFDTPTVEAKHRKYKVL